MSMPEISPCTVAKDSCYSTTITVKEQPVKEDNGTSKSKSQTSGPLSDALIQNGRASDNNISVVVVDRHRAPQCLDTHISSVVVVPCREDFPSIPPTYTNNESSNGNNKETLYYTDDSTLPFTAKENNNNNNTSHKEPQHVTLPLSGTVETSSVPSSSPKRCFSFNPNARPWHPAPTYVAPTEHKININSINNSTTSNTINSITTSTSTISSSRISAPPVYRSGRIGRGLPASATAHLSSMFGGGGSFGMCMAGGRPSSRLNGITGKQGEAVVDSVLSPRSSVSSTSFPGKSSFSNPNLSCSCDNLTSPINSPIHSKRRVISNVLLNPGSVNEAKYTQEESAEDQLHHFDVSFPDNMPGYLCDDGKDEEDQLYGSHGFGTEALINAKMDILKDLEVDTGLHSNNVYSRHHQSMSNEYPIATDPPCDVKSLGNSICYMNPDNLHSKDGIREDMFPIRAFSNVGLPASKILDFLYLGGISDAVNQDFLRSANIGTIVNISTEGYWKSDLPEGMIVKTFPLSDRSDVPISTIFDEFYEILEGVRRAYFRDVDLEMEYANDVSSVANEKVKTDDDKEPNAKSTVATTVGDLRGRRQRVLVHCQKGRSRSPTAVASYLMRKNGWNLEDTLDFLKSRRFVVQPNIGFIEQLWKFQTKTLTDEDRKKNLATQCLLVTDIHQSWTENAIQIEVERILKILMTSNEKRYSASNITSTGRKDDKEDFDEDSYCIVWKVAREKECMTPNSNYRVMKRCNDLEAVFGTRRDTEENGVTIDDNSMNSTCSTIVWNRELPCSTSNESPCDDSNAITVNDNNDNGRENTAQTTANPMYSYSILRLAQVCSNAAHEHQSQSPPMNAQFDDHYVDCAPSTTTGCAPVSAFTVPPHQRNPVRTSPFLGPSSNGPSSVPPKEIRPKTSIFFTCAENMIRFRMCPAHLLMRLMEEADADVRSESESAAMVYDTYQKFDPIYDIGDSGEDDDELEMELIDENGFPLDEQIVDRQMMMEFTPIELAWLEEQARVTRGREADELW